MTATAAQKAPLLACAASFVLLLYIFAAPIGALVKGWQTPEYSHGYLLPILAALMAFHRLASAPPQPRPAWSGLLFLVLSLGLYFLGDFMAARQIVFVGLWFGMIGFCGAFLGGTSLKALIPAFIYLLFTLPVPTELYNKLSLDMQLISSYLGVAMLDALRISVFQSGNIVDLGVYKLQVAEACSGLRYLFPLMSFGFLASYLLHDRPWKKAVLFLSTIPITIFMNALRIATAGIAVNQWGIGMAEGVSHEFHGWIVFVICILLLLGEANLLLRVKPRGAFDHAFFTLPRGPFLSSPLILSRPALVFVIALACAAIFFAADPLKERSPIIPIRKDFTYFPMQLGDWHGTTSSIDPDALNLLQPTDYLQADYSNSGEKAPVSFYIAYYAVQRTGSTIHAPTNCLPGSGWRIIDTQKRLFTPASGRPFVLMRLIVKSGEQKLLIYYWFDEQGHRVTSQLIGRWDLMKDALLENRSDGGLIRAMTPLLPDENIDAAEARLTALLSLALPAASGFIPAEDR